VPSVCESIGFFDTVPSRKPILAFLTVVKHVERGYPRGCVETGIHVWGVGKKRRKVNIPSAFYTMEDPDMRKQQLG
jgi:hypothetical protein